MKKVSIFLWLFISICLAQKADNTWVLGSIIQFDDTLPFTSSQTLGIGIDLDNTSISDSNGHLLFYTNGVSIWNRNNYIIQNGYHITSGWVSQNQWANGLTIAQGVLFLPSPNDTNIYYLFHECGELLYEGAVVQPLQLYCTTIDKSANNGVGKVTERMKVIVSDTIVYGELTACKHANGKDWWVLVAVPNHNLYYRFLVSDKGVLGPYTQNIGAIADAADGGTAVFSPDGSKYARYDVNAGRIYLYDFDRCRGSLSNPIVINRSTDGAIGGISISPNSRFLYAISTYHVYQYDLNAANVAASCKTVGFYNGAIYQGNHLYMSLSQLAPDGKIYIAIGGNAPWLHVIHQPDSEGVACNFELLGVALPYYSRTMPHHPNYRLGAAAVVCDTVFTSVAIESPQEKELLSLYPNPAQNKIHLSFSQKLAKNTLFSLRDLQGRVVFSQTLREGGEDFVLEIGDLAKGMYFWEAKAEGKLLQAGKLLCE